MKKLFTRAMLALVLVFTVTGFICRSKPSLSPATINTSIPSLQPKIYTDYVWPEIFTNPNFSYPGNAKQPETAIADGLSGWGLIYIGTDIPKFFGQGMAGISVILGCIATPENINKLYEDLKTDQSDVLPDSLI